MLNKTRKVALAVAVACGNVAGATDIKLGLNSSLTLGCQVAGARASVQEGRLGVFGQAAYCKSNVEGQDGSASFGGGISFDLFTANHFTTYALAGADLVSGVSAVHAGLGVRYGIALLPVEAYLEAGVQRINTALQPVIGPRVALGVNYRFTVASPNWSALTAATSGGTSNSAGQRPGGMSYAPATCNLTAGQDEAAVRAAATAAANEALSAAANAYASLYSNVSYSLSISRVVISGDTAQLMGSVTLSATERSSGNRVSGTYPGTVNLVRSGCGWQATGYSQR